MTVPRSAGKSMWLKALPLILVVLGIFALVTHMEELGWLTPAPAQAPDFDLPRIDRLQGDGEPGRMQLAALRGRPVLVNFWASWCKQCKAELPIFRVLGEQATTTPWRGTLLGISTGDALVPATAEVLHNALPYQMAFDAGDQVSTRYGVNGLPHTILIDADGRIVKRYARVLTTEDLPTIIQHLR